MHSAETFSPDSWMREHKIPGEAKIPAEQVAEETAVVYISAITRSELCSKFQNKCDIPKG